MNTVCLSGHIAEAPTTREGKNGKPYSTFTLSVDDGFREGQKHVFACVAFGRACEKIKDLGSGTLVGIVGQLQTRTFKEKTVVEVIADRAEVIEAGKADGQEDSDDPWAGQ